MSQWRPRRLPGGPIVQGGMNPQNRQTYQDRFTPRSFGYRAVVVNTFTSTTAGRKGHQVLCDVILFKGQVPLSKVPVSQSSIGVNHAHAPYIPNPTTRTLSGDPLQFRVLSDQGSPVGRASDLADLDGDWVLVTFVEGDINQPMIIAALDRDDSNRQIVDPDGNPVYGTMQSDEYYVHHRGTELRINGDGDFLLDALQSYGDDFEDEDPASGGGQVRVRLKSDKRFTVEVDGTDVLEVWKDGSQVRIDLGEAADERLVLGDSFRDFFNDTVSDLDARWTQLFNIHVHADPTTGVTGTPQTPGGTPLTVGPTPADTLDLLTSMAEALLSDLAKAKKS